MACKLRAFLSRTALERTGRKTERRRHSKAVCARVNCHTTEGRSGAGGQRREPLVRRSIENVANGGGQGRLPSRSNCKGPHRGRRVQSLPIGTWPPLLFL